MIHLTKPIVLPDGSETSQALLQMSLAEKTDGTYTCSATLMPHDADGRPVPECALRLVARAGDSVNDDAYARILAILQGVAAARGV